MANRNVVNILLILDQIGFKRFNTTPTFKNLLWDNQRAVLKVGENTLGVNHSVWSTLQRMADMHIQVKRTDDVPKHDGTRQNGVPYYQFLDYQILDFTGLSSDGYVLAKDEKASRTNLKPLPQECNLGNWDDLEVCKEFAVLYFMIRRPETFGHAICYRCYKKQGSGTWGEYQNLQEVVQREGLKMPAEVVASKDGNFGITYKGKRI